MAPRTTVVTVSCRPLAARARMTARSAVATGQGAVVLDLDGTFPALDGVRVLAPADAAIDERTVRREMVRHGPPATARHAAAAAAAVSGPVVVAAPGLVLLAAVPVVEPFVLRRTAAADGRHPDDADLARFGEHSPTLVGPGALRPPGPDLRAALVAAGARSLPERELVLSAWTVTPAAVVTATPGGLLLDGAAVTAVDLSGLDLERPWLLDARLGDPRGRLSDHPALAAWVADVVAEARTVPVPDGRWDPERTVLGGPVHPLLRDLADEPGAPDVLAGDPAQVAAWLTAPEGATTRYLAALRRRPDLAGFPATPAGDAAFLDWCDRFGRVDLEADPDLVARSLERLGRPAPTPGPVVPRPVAPAAGTARLGPGVNVVGLLGGTVGIGESARLMIAAFTAGGVPHTAVALDHLAVGAGPGPAADALAPAGAGRVHRTTLVCVNADLTGAAAAAEPDLFARTYRVGMWYWEVEDFPASQHGGFDNVDEVWVASDFVRAAIAPHAPVPVRVVTPPLPQAGPVPPASREDLGLPEGFTFLFVFDHLSTAERKNPWGLIDAFTRAFGPQEGVALVVKSLHGDLRPADAERLRLAAAPHPHVHLDERHLSAAERDALVAHCDAYVSLHRAEGLGLTMAEAMARGKPVVATRYGGNLAFMTEENSFLVPWDPVPIGHAPPYPPGGTWAAPDLDAAAAAMRAVVANPEEARTRGARAARDVATQHSPAAAAARVLAALDASADRRRARLRVPLRRRVGRLVRAVRG